MEEQQQEEIYFPEHKSKIDPMTILAVAGIVIVVILCVLAIRNGDDKKPVSPKDEFIQQTIDTAAKVNVELQAKQATLDSIAHSIDEKLNILDEKVSKVKNKETIIREYYHDRISKPGGYTPHQIDSFFKDRYNY
jgi:hypothetical protein